jgi:hypothetical protein
MLANRPAEWKRRWTQAGRQEGIAEGERKGEAAALTRLLGYRFGPLPDAARDRIASADIRTLQAWSLRVLDAASLDEVLR